MIHAYQDSWRTHQELDHNGQVKPGEFRYCQDVMCPQDHFISSLYGSRPVRDDVRPDMAHWEGMLDADGKVGK